MKVAIIRADTTDEEIATLVGRAVEVRGTPSFFWASDCASVVLGNRHFFLDGFTADWPDGVERHTIVEAKGTLVRKKIIRDPIIGDDGRPVSNGAFGDQLVLYRPAWRVQDSCVLLSPKKVDLRVAEYEELYCLVGHLVALRCIVRFDDAIGWHCVGKDSEFLVLLDGRHAAFSEGVNVIVVGRLDKGPALSTRGLDEDSVYTLSVKNVIAGRSGGSADGPFTVAWEVAWPRQSGGV